MNQRKPWRPDWGLPVFILAGIALARLVFGFLIGHLDPEGLANCVAIGIGVGLLLHYWLSRRPRS